MQRLKIKEQMTAAGRCEFAMANEKARRKPSAARAGSLSAWNKSWNKRSA